MEKKILYFSLGALLVIAIFMIAYIIKYAPQCYRVHLEENMELWGTTDAVPDEDTARKIADAIIDTQPGLDRKLAYDVKIDYDEMSNIWKIHYVPQTPNSEPSILGREIIFHIRKDNALVTGLSYLP